MKRMVAILLAALMLTGVLTACSGSVGMDDGRAYGNVSTTPNGTVNGSGQYNSGYQGSNWSSGSQNGSGSHSGSYHGSGSGTGMAGSR